MILPNGEYYRDPVPKIETADALQLTPDAIDALQLPTHSTQPTKLKGSEILATGVKVSSVEEVQDLYRKVCVDPYSAAADHRILVYRFVDSAGKTHESFWDDGEHGAGRRLALQVLCMLALMPDYSYFHYFAKQPLLNKLPLA